MSGPTYSASSTTKLDPDTGKLVTTGTFTFLARQDRHLRETAERVTRCKLKRGQFRIGEPIRFTYNEGDAQGTLL